MEECEDSRCKVFDTRKQGKYYLLSLNRIEIKLIMDDETKRKWFKEAVKKCNCRLDEYYNIVDLGK